MTRKEEIIEAGIEYTMSTNPVCISGDAFAEQMKVFNRNRAFEAGAEWMEKKIVEKACEWLMHNVNRYINDEGAGYFRIEKTLFDHFRKAMEE